MHFLNNMKLCDIGIGEKNISPYCKIIPQRISEIIL